MTANLIPISQEAQTIILDLTQASSTTLQGKIEVVGKAAELIILGKNQLTCRDCQFVNTPRLILSTGELQVFNNGRISKLKVQQGTLSIRGKLRAQDAVFFDLVADKIDIDGIVQTQFRVNKENQMSSNGQSTVASGLMQVIAGHFDYDYFTAKAMPYKDVKEYIMLLVYLLNQKYKRVNFFLSSSINPNSKLTIAGDIITKADKTLQQVALSSNLTVIPDHSINIKSFSSLQIKRLSLITDGTIHVAALNAELMAKKV